MKLRAKAIDELLKNLNVYTDIRKIIITKYKIAEEKRQKIQAELKTSIFTVFISENEKSAVILRRDAPKIKQGNDINNKTLSYVPRAIQMLHWNLETDVITPGQWIGNKKIRVNNSMVSPNGEYFLYAIEIPGGPYKDYTGGIDYLTVISKPPYFTGLLVLRSIECQRYNEVYGRMIGGEWISDESIKLNSAHYCDSNRIENGSIPEWLTIVDDDVRRTQLSHLRIMDLKQFIIDNDMNICVSNKRKSDIVEAIISYENSRIKPKKKTSVNIPFIDPKKRKIDFIDGCITVNGKKIYDCSNDVFTKITPSNNYRDSWTNNTCPTTKIL